MQVETSNSDPEKDLTILQECNAAISNINRSLQTTLANLDALSVSINR